MGSSHKELHFEMLTRVLEAGQNASFALQKKNMHWASTIKVVLAWVLASVPSGTGVGVRFLPRPVGRTDLLVLGQQQFFLKSDNCGVARYSENPDSFRGFLLDSTEICTQQFLLIGRRLLTFGLAGFGFRFGAVLPPRRIDYLWFGFLSFCYWFLRFAWASGLRCN